MDDKRSWQKGISIHTPTRGVTPFPPLSCCMTANFNPHSHKGSDARIAPLYGGYGYINLHSHKGSDRPGHSDIAYTVISIHTPTRGVTVHIRETYLYKGNFNPHSHKGSDCIGHHMEHLTEEFQSTLPQGE